MKNIQSTVAKAMSTMFAQIDNVKYDMATGQTGIVTEGGLVTLGADGTLDQNPMDFFSLELPAFAMLTPAAEIKRGDIIVSGGKAYAFILEAGLKPQDPEAENEEQVTKGELRTINVQGHVSRFRPRKVQMMGISDGLTVVRSFTNLFGNMESKNPMENMLPLLLMSKNENTNLLPLMMMMGNSNMNPMMMMMLMGDGKFDSLFK